MPAPNSFVPQACNRCSFLEGLPAAAGPINTYFRVLRRPKGPNTFGCANPLATAGRLGNAPLIFCTFFLFILMLFSFFARRMTPALAALLLLGLAPAARAQCNLSVGLSSPVPVALCAGGSTTLTAQASTPGFQAFAGFDGAVMAVLVQPDGKILVGGAFTTYNNLDVPDGLIRLNADGSRDLSFIPIASPGFTGFAGEPGPIVRSLAVQPDGKILVSGRFARFDFSLTAGLVRLNGTDGSRDITFGGNGQVFDPGGTSFGNPRPDIKALALQPDGQVLVSGTLTAYGGVPTNRSVLRLSATGMVDASFIPVGAGPVGNVGPMNTVLALALQPDGKILVSGNFTNYQSTRSTPAPAGLMRLNANGTFDASFNTFAPVANAGFNDGGGTLTLQPDGKVVIAASNSYSSVTTHTYNGVAVPNLLRVNPDGSLDASFNPGGRGVLLSVTTGGIVAGISALALQPDGKVLVGGQFDGYNNAAASNCLLRLTPSGLPDASYNAGGNGIAGANSSFGMVLALALQPDGRLLVGGNIGYYNGLDVPGSILRLNADGSSNFGPQPVAGASYTWSNGATGPSLTVSQPGVYSATAGSGGCTATSLGVRVLAATPTAVRVVPAGPLSLPAGGSATLTAAAVVPGFNVGGSGTTGVFEAVIALPDGKTLAGGSFNAYNGSSVAQSLIRLNADGTLDNTFNPGGSGFNSQVSVLALQSDGKIIVGGAFTSYNGNAAAPDKVLRLNADGTLDNTFNQTSIPTNVEALAVQPDGKILLSADTPVPTGANVYSIVRLNPNGSLDTGFNVGGTGASGEFFDIVVQPDGRILLGGVTRQRYNNAFAPEGVIRLYADGTLDDSFGSLGGTYLAGTYALALQPDGKVVVGGIFSLTTRQQGYLTRLNANGTLDTSFNPGGSGFEFNGNVEDVVLQPDGKVLVSGLFTTYNGNAAAPDRLLRLNINGTLDNTFNSGGVGVNGYLVRAIALQADGKVIAGGEFTGYNGNAAAPDGIMRVNPNGTLDNADMPLAGATYAWSPGGSPGPTLAVTASGSYTATASVPGGCGGTSAPVVVTVVATPASSSLVVPANGTYGPLAGAALNALSFTLAFNQPITVTGTPQLALTIGSATRQAGYVSGSGTAALVFRYAVVAGDLDTDGIDLTALALNGGTLRNNAGTAATLALPAVPSLAAVLVDGVAPAGASSTRLAPATAFTNAPSASFQVVFSEPVTGVTAADFTLTAGGTATGTVSSVSGSGSTYTVAVSAPAGNGTLRLDLRASGTGIVDAVNNPITTGYTAGQAFSFDRVAPVSTRTGQPANPTVSTTATFAFAATDATVGGVSSGVARAEASLDGAAFAPVTSPATYTGLSVGSHSFALRAVDNAGNVETAAPAYVWLVQPLAAAPALTAATLGLYPNPARRTATVRLPAVPGAAQATLILTDALGRTVQRRTLALPATGTRAELDLTGLTPGVYALCVVAGGQAAVRRLVVE